MSTQRIIRHPIKVSGAFSKKLKTDSAGISVLKKDGQTAISSQEKAEILNNQFSSVFTNEDTSNIPQPEGKISPDIDQLIIDTNGITKLLQKLNPNKAAGPYALSTRLLKETAKESAPILRKIFQKSIDSGELPKDWKMANIAPVYKKENRCIPSNYRPVSLTSVTCKLLEHVVNRHIINHLDNHILVDNQHGFCSRRSCETQLVLTSNDLAAELDKGGQVP